MWNPVASGLRTLHDEGKVSVLPAVGYAGPDQSHFTSQHYWEVGALDAGAQYGWLGRFLDLHGSPTNPLQGLSIASSLSPALAPASNPVAAVSRLDDFRLSAPGVHDDMDDLMYAAIGTLGRLPTDDPHRQRARAVATQVDGIRASLAPYQGGVTAPVSYPSGTFGSRLKGLAAGIKGGLPLRCVALSAPGGYDTHSGQLESFGNDLRETSDGLLAFQRDLEARGIADRVLTLVWSEFGRRPQQNDSGTDHGAAGVGFVIGSQAKGTMVGEFPGSGDARRPGQPAVDIGFPQPLRVAAGAVVRRRRRADHPRRRVDGPLHAGPVGRFRRRIAPVTDRTTAPAV